MKQGAGPRGLEILHGLGTEGEAVEPGPPETACPAGSLLGRGHSTSRNLARRQPSLRRSRPSSTGSPGLPTDTGGRGQTTSLQGAVWEKKPLRRGARPSLPHAACFLDGLGPALCPTAGHATPSA